MKVLKLLIIASIITYAAARVVGPQVVEARKKTKLQSKQDDDPEGVDVDSDIPVANIQVFEVSTSASSASVEDNNSVETSSLTSAETTATSAESTESSVVNEDDSNPINRYCKCSSFECDCCRDFALPLVQLRGAGCANIRYLEGDRLSVGIKFGNRVLANRIVSGRKSTPVCLPLPGGFTNFCGRIYGISKKNENFKACLGLELRSDEEVEAALRVSCFDFGPRGLRVTDAEPIPVAPADEEDEDDDDDDFFGFDGSDDDDDDDDILGDDDSEDDSDKPEGQSAVQQPTTSNDDEDDDDDVDYTGLSLLSGDFLDDILGDDDDSSDASQQPTRKNVKKKKVTQQQEVTENVENNEVDGALNDEEIVEEAKPAQSTEDDDDDDDEDLISGDDDDEEQDEAEEQLEDEISEEIVQNELEDDTEEVAEEVDDVTSNVKDAENYSYDDNDLEDQALEESVDDDDDDSDDEDRPTSYSGLSLLGLRKFFSRFFH